MTFERRSEKYPCEYWLRTKALSWGFVRVLVGFWVWVLGCGEGFCYRVENSLRDERIGGLNSNGFILLRCISIETM